MEIKIIKASDRAYLTPEVKTALRAAGFIPIVVNDVYIPYIWDRTRFQNFYGGSGGGKSDFVAVRYLIWALTYPYFRLLFSRKFKETIKDSQFLLLKDVIAREELGEYFEVKEQPMDIVCKSNGNLLLSGGLDDIEKLKSISDITDVWLEEPLDKRARASSVTLADFTELDRRVRTIKLDGVLALTFNPVRKESWLYEQFFQLKNFEPCIRVKTTYRDNAYTSPNEIAKYNRLKEVDENEWDVYANGNWGTIKEGLVYPNFEIVENFPDDCTKVGCGQDYGFSNDPSTGVRCGVLGDYLYWDELYYETGLITPQIADKWKEVVRPNEVIYSENASGGDRLNEELRRAYRLNVIDVKKGAGSIETGIELINRYKIRITKRSKNLIYEVNNYTYKIVQGKSINIPIDDYNHALDAVRYYALMVLDPTKTNRSRARSAIV